MSLPRTSNYLRHRVRAHKAQTQHYHTIIVCIDCGEPNQDDATHCWNCEKPFNQRIQQAMRGSMRAA